MPRGVEDLPSKREALGSVPNTTKLHTTTQQNGPFCQLWKKCELNWTYSLLPIRYANFKKVIIAKHWWLISVILATPETKIRRITVSICERYQENTQHEKGLGRWFKWWSACLASVRVSSEFKPKYCQKKKGGGSAIQIADDEREKSSYVFK
jgi:hypothetical protein